MVYCIGTNAYWWSANDYEKDNMYAFVWLLSYDTSTVLSNGCCLKECAFTVRCVKD
jgi:uncharacterized protein (TIGR02145 family)